MNSLPDSNLPPPPPHTSGYSVAQTVETNGLAIGSMVLGIVGFLGFGFVTSIPAIVLGHIARSQIRKNPRQSGDGMALAGLIMGYIVTVLSLLFIVVLIAVFAFGVMEANESGLFEQLHKQIQEELSKPEPRWHEIPATE